MEMQRLWNHDVHVAPFIYLTLQRPFPLLYLKGRKSNGTGSSTDSVAAPHGLNETAIRTKDPGPEEEVDDDEGWFHTAIWRCFFTTFLVINGGLCVSRYAAATVAEERGKME